MVWAGAEVVPRYVFVELNYDPSHLAHRFFERFLDFASVRTQLDVLARTVRREYKRFSMSVDRDMFDRNVLTVQIDRLDGKHVFHQFDISSGDVDCIHAVSSGLRNEPIRDPLLYIVSRIFAYEWLVPDLNREWPMLRFSFWMKYRNKFPSVYHVGSNTMSN